MTPEELARKVREWDQRSTGSPFATSKYEIILDQLSYHAKREWRSYLPATNSAFNSNYMERLASWVGNLADETDQQVFLEYALHISFFSHDDFVALYQTAFEREITRWVAEQIGVRLDSGGWTAFRDVVDHQLRWQTWFCPITDSMDINEFYKVNHLIGPSHRPHFWTQEMLAKTTGSGVAGLGQRWTDYMANPSQDPQRRLPSLERLVLLEDIVGSGKQCLEAVQWAVSNLGKPVLFVPLILCPNGRRRFHQEEVKSNGRLKVRPVIELRPGDLLGPERPKNAGWAISERIEKLAERCKARATPDQDTFGFENTGCSLATYSNTPDNTLPIVHSVRPGNWDPLFPRVRRG